MNPRRNYIPALSYRWLTRFYDPIMRITTRESVFKEELIAQAQIGKGQRILDIGCGTATLTIFIKQTHPEVEVVGLDIDSQILEIARAKTAGGGLDIALDQGSCFELPYPDNSFDRVFSSLMFHHLTHDNKLRTFKEVLRVLRPGGELHVADWGKPKNCLMRTAFFIVQLVDGFITTQDNVSGLLPHLFEQAGFGEVKETGSYSTVFGTLCLYRVHKA